MKFSGSALAALIVVSVSLGDAIDRDQRIPDGDAHQTRIRARLPDPPNAPVRVGDPAPDFSWTGVDNQTYKLREVLEKAHALVVFAPDDDTLRELERDREMLATMGVVPVAVIEARGRSVSRRARKAGAHFLLVPDPVRVIGAQFNQVDSRTNRLQPGWYAVDRRGTVRGAGGSLEAPQGWARIAASALAIPLPGNPLPAQTR